VSSCNGVLSCDYSPLPVSVCFHDAQSQQFFQLMGCCGSHGNSDVHGHDLSEKFGFRSVSQCECMFGNVTVHA